LLDLPGDPDSGIDIDGQPEAFVGANRNHNVPRPTSQPIPAITSAGGGGMFLVETIAAPFIISRFSNDSTRPVEQPLPTIVGHGTGQLIEPVAEPLILGQHGGGVARPVDQPLPTITTDGAISVIEPLVMPYYGTGQADRLDQPLATVTAKARFGLASPLAVPYGPKAEARSVDDPLPTVMTRDRLAVATPTVEPFLVPGFSERAGQLPRLHSIDEPVPTIEQARQAAVDQRRLILVDGQPYLLDIRFRMLTIRELARAMGFDDDEHQYEFIGNVGEVTRQIGNAVACGTACALVTAILGPTAAASQPSEEVA
jgi:DNA (cytosine-5)-methyltransferase 1